MSTAVTSQPSTANLRSSVPFAPELITAYEDKATFVQGKLTCGTVTVELDATDLRKFLEQADALGQSTARDLALGFGFEVDPWKYESLRPCLMGMLQNVFLRQSIADASQVDHLMSMVRAKQEKRIVAYHQKLAVLRAKPVPVVKVKPFGDIVRGRTASAGAPGTPRSTGGPRAVPGSTYTYQLLEDKLTNVKLVAGGQKALVVKAMADLNRAATAREIWERVQANGSFVTGQGQRASDWILGEGAKGGWITKTLVAPTSDSPTVEPVAKTAEPAAPVAEPEKPKGKKKSA